MIASPESLIELLKEIAQLLERNGHPGQAEYVSALATVASWDPRAAEPGLASGAMWGGAGSVWEVGGWSSTGDRRRFTHLLVSLVDELRHAGISAPGAESRATIMSRWLESGIV